MTNQQQAQNGKQEIKIIDNIPGAEYSNIAQIAHTKEEFLIKFLNVIEGGGRVVGKMILSPAHLKRMVVAMNENLKKYEENFGEIKEAVGLDKEIGFKAN